MGVCDLSSLPEYIKREIASIPFSTDKVYSAGRFQSSRGPIANEWAKHLSSFGWPGHVIVACLAVAWTECGWKPTGNPNRAELRGGGVAGTAGWRNCGEGTIGFTFWKTKLKWIQAYNRDSRSTKKLPEDPNQYDAGPHISDLDLRSQLLMNVLFYQNVVSKYGNGDFATLVAEMFLEKAGRGFGKSGTSIDRAYQAAEVYSRSNGGKYNTICCNYKSVPEIVTTLQSFGFNVSSSGFSSGGGNHQWPDFNVKPFPIFVDKNGKYTNEPILMGIVNHLRIEGSPGAEENLNTGDMGGELSVNGGKFSGSVSVNVVNPNVYNIVLYRYNKCSSGVGDGHNAVEGVIFEYSTKDIITYTIEDETDIRNTGFGLKFKNPYKVIPSGHGWCNSAPHHRGCSQYTVSLSHGQGGFGSSTGAYNTMLATDHKPGCLFHPGASTTWSEGCILCGQKATNGRRSMQASDFYPDTIMRSNAEAVKWYKNFYNKIVPKICSGTTVHLYVTGVIAPG